MTADQLQRLTLLSPTPALVIGVLLLTFGRKLFWLFVAVIGFVIGAEVAEAMFPHQPAWTIVGGLALGLMGGLVAILVQKFAIAAGGFLAGGYFLMAVCRAWALQAPEYSWVTFLLGGVVGAALMILLFDWALIIFSSISGAHLIVHAFSLNQAMAAAVFVALLLVGCAIQGRILASRVPLP
jgi:hypothetical protein